jgi:hypothetical protein
MFGGLNRLLAGSAVAGVMFVAAAVAPSAALACGSGTSAVNVYKECLPSGGGGNSGGGRPTTPATKSVTHPSGKTAPVSNRTLLVLKHAGKDKSALTNLVKGYGLQRRLQGVHASEASATPSALGSAFDLGSGPTVLLIVLAGTAALLLGGTGMRGWRSRHRP